MHAHASQKQSKFFAFSCRVYPWLRRLELPNTWSVQRSRRRVSKLCLMKRSAQCCALCPGRRTNASAWSSKAGLWGGTAGTRCTRVAGVPLTDWLIGVSSLVRLFVRRDGSSPPDLLRQGEGGVWHVAGLPRWGFLQRSIRHCRVRHAVAERAPCMTCGYFLCY